MPYITKEKRQKLTEITCIYTSVGDLNYILTCTIRAYLKQKGLSYQTCNDIVGALDNAKDEFRRRVLHPYEDGKIEDNGDVYL